MQLCHGTSSVHAFYVMSEFFWIKLCALIIMVSVLGAWHIHVWLILHYFILYDIPLVVYVAPNK